MTMVQLVIDSNTDIEQFKKNYPHLYELLIDERSGKIKSKDKLEKFLREHACKMTIEECPLHQPG